MKAGIIIYGLEGNFDIASRTWSFIDNFDSDVVFSIGQGITTEALTKEKYPNSKFNRDMTLDGSESERNVRLIKQGYSLLNNEYDFVILMKINSYIIADNGFDFLNDCNENDKIYGYRPIKIIGKQLFYVPDYFFIGLHGNMDVLIKNLPNVVETDINDMIPKTLLKNELYIQDIGPFFYIEEVFNNIVTSYQNLTPYELKIKAAEWKLRK
jgi:hypothetical protein